MLTVINKYYICERSGCLHKWMLFDQALCYVSCVKCFEDDLQGYDCYCEQRVAYCPIRTKPVSTARLKELSAKIVRVEHSEYLHKWMMFDKAQSYVSCVKEFEADLQG